MSPVLVGALIPKEVQVKVDNDGPPRMPSEALDGPEGAHNPKVGGSNPPPARGATVRPPRYEPDEPAAWRFVGLVNRCALTSTATALISLCLCTLGHFAGIRLPSPLM